MSGHTHLFSKSLQDLVKGIRNHKRDSTKYISDRVAEIKEELKSGSPQTKTVAVQKATYLHMIGYDVSWSSFHIVECMSLPRFSHKRIGMLAAAQTFDPDTDVILLCTNLLKKELQSKNYYETGIAMNALANVATRELARDLLEDVAGMLSSSKPYLRKKAILTLYKMLVRYPQGLRATYDRLRHKLEDPELAVVSCSVNVMCELSRTNPKNYLALAPQLFQLLTTTSNNWMLIKIVKLMGSLLQEEPRLARKLLEPLATIIQTTPAKSLLYECISTVTQALQYTARADGTQPKAVPGVVALCTTKLREFVEDADQNLKYLGLVGLVALMQSHPRVVSEHRELVLRCLMDDDITVRLRALELLTGMVTKRNLVDIVQKLLEHVQSAEGRYRDELIGKIIFVCSRDKYAYLSNFAWYVSVLVDLAHINGTPHGSLVAGQLMDVAVRVPSVRRFAAHAMASLVLDGRLALQCGGVTGGTGTSGGGSMGSATSSDEVGNSEEKTRGAMSEVLSAAAFIACEFCDLLMVDDRDGEDGELQPVDLGELASAMLVPHTLQLPPSVQSVFMHNVLKLVAAVARFEVAGGHSTATQLLLCGDDDADATQRDHENEAVADARMGRVRAIADMVARGVALFTHSEQVEVQERAVAVIEIMSAIGLCERTPTAERSSGDVLCAPAAASTAENPLINLEGGTTEDTDTPNETMDLASATEASPGSPDMDYSDELRRISSVLDDIFQGDLAPVNSKAQRRVPVPEGLDLDRQIFEEGSVVADGGTVGESTGRVLIVSFEKHAIANDTGDGNAAAWLDAHSNGLDIEDGGTVLADLAAEGERQRSRSRDVNEGTQPASTNHRKKDDPFYLGGGSRASTSKRPVGRDQSSPGDEDDIDIPIMRLSSGELGRIDAGGVVDTKNQTRDSLTLGPSFGLSRGESARRRASRESSTQQSAVVVMTDEVMPDGAIQSDDEGMGVGSRRQRRTGTMDSEDFTLADIDVTKASDEEDAGENRRRKPERSRGRREGEGREGRRRRHREDREKRHRRSRPRKDDAHAKEGDLLDLSGDKQVLPTDSGQQKAEDNDDPGEKGGRRRRHRRSHKEGGESRRHHRSSRHRRRDGTEVLDA